MAATSAQQTQPQIYLVTPQNFDLADFSPKLIQVLEAHDVACVRLAMGGLDEGKLSKTADALREICHARDIAIVITDHIAMVERLGLDGVHLTDGTHQVRYARKELGPEAIVGAGCGVSRHEGMAAGEAGADYISFGPMRENTLGDGSFADTELFQWWSDVIELPIVAEGLLDIDTVKTFAPISDFFAVGDEIWGRDDPSAALAELIAAMQSAV